MISSCEMSDGQLSPFDMSNIGNSLSLYSPLANHKILRGDSENLKSASLILSQKLNFENEISKKGEADRLALAPNAPIFKPKSDYLMTIEENNNYMESINQNMESKMDIKHENVQTSLSNQLINSSIYSQMSNSLWKTNDDIQNESNYSFVNNPNISNNATIEQLIQQSNMHQQQQAMITNIQQRALMSLQNRKIHRNLNASSTQQYLHSLLEQQLCNDMNLASQVQKNGNLRQIISQEPSGRQIVASRLNQNYETLSRSRNSLPFPRYLLQANSNQNNNVSNSANSLLSVKQEQGHNFNIENINSNLLATLLKSSVSQDQIKRLQDSASSSTSSMDQMVPTTGRNGDVPLYPIIPQASSVEQFSRKVFVGGLPPDIDEEEINASFRQFGPHVVDWPHKAESRSYFPPKGYCFLLFQEERSVQMLINVCIVEDGKLYWCVSSPTTKDKPVQIRPWNIFDADFVMDTMQPLDSRKTIFVGGVPRPLRAIELAVIIDRLYGGVCYAGIDTDPELKYPKGAGRVAFSNQQSYIAAISARFVQLQHGEIDKRVEVKPYVLDDQFCDECQGVHCGGKFAPFFCANVACLQYYCEHCWATIHTRPGREFHKPLVKEGADRPRSIPYRWC